MNTNYDVIIICFADSTLDARTINLVKTLIKYKRTVALATRDFHSKPSYIEAKDYYPISVNFNQKVRNSQKEFTKKIKKLKLSSRIVQAGDYYSLDAAKSIKMRTGAKLVYDSREIYSQLNSLQNRYFAKAFLTFKEKYLVTYVDRMVVTAEADEKYLRKHFSHGIAYHIIKNLPPKLELTPNNSLRELFKIPDSNLVLLYQGWILEGRGLDILLESVKSIDNVSLIIIGDGEYKKKLTDSVTKLNLTDKVFFTGFVPYEKLHEYTMSADIGFVLFENTSISYQNALPNKLFEFIQSAIPVITTNQKTIAEIVESEKIGFVVDNLDSKNLTGFIEEMKKDKVRKNYQENTMQIRDKYNYESQEIEILKVYS